MPSDRAFPRIEPELGSGPRVYGRLRILLRACPCLYIDPCEGQRSTERANPTEPAGRRKAKLAIDHGTISEIIIAIISSKF